MSGSRVIMRWQFAAGKASGDPLRMRRRCTGSTRGPRPENSGQAAGEHVGRAQQVEECSLFRTVRPSFAPGEPLPSSVVIIVVITITVKTQFSNTGLAGITLRCKKHKVVYQYKNSYAAKKRSAE